MSKASRKVVVAGEFPMYRGGNLLSPTIVYETWGQLSPNRDNCVLIFTGLSPSAHAASSEQDPAPGWWEEIVGPGHPIDTRKYFVVCVNSLGSCFGSTGPASIDPRTGEKYRLDFPVLSLEDVARGGYEVLTALGIEKTYAIVGPSMGGMTALAFESLYPGMNERLVVISSGPRSEPFSIAMRSLQREMIRRDPLFDEGRYTRETIPMTGMRMARKLGMITYRSAEEWRMRFGRERTATEPTGGSPFGIVYEVESYLEHHANKFIGQFDPNCYLYLSRASDLFDVAEHSGSVGDSLREIKAKKALIIGVKTDFLFPIHQQKEIADGLNENGCDAQFLALDCIQGHDSFLVDMDGFRPPLKKFFAA